MSGENMIHSHHGYHRQPTVLLHYVGDELLRGILKPARERGWRLVDMAVTQGGIPRGCSPIGAIIGLPVDHPAMSWLQGLDCPVVRVGLLPHPLDHHVPAAIVDYRAAGRLAAEHFAERNFKHVVYIGLRPWHDLRRTYDSFNRRAKQLGCTCDLFRLTNKGDASKAALFERRAREVEEWLLELPKPVGLFTYGDSQAVWLETICDSAKLTMPEDVAILGLGNNTIVCKTAPVEVSSVDLANNVQCREAVRLLHCLVEGKAVPRKAVVIPPAGVVERQSTNVLAVPDPVVAKAVRYIWDHLELQVSVDHIAAHVGVSRRSLERAFRGTLGRSVNGERLRKRLERCAELLHGSQMTVEDIAVAAGFPSRSHMYRAFQKQYHLSPGQFRKRGRK